jgi:hypothetical protein
VPAGPADLSGGSWLVSAKRALKEYKADDLQDRAAALTYFGIQSIFPGLLVLVIPGTARIVQLRIAARRHRRAAAKATRRRRRRRARLPARMSGPLRSTGGPSMTDSPNEGADHGRDQLGETAEPSDGWCRQSASGKRV